MKIDYQIGDFVKIDNKKQYYPVGYILQVTKVNKNWIDIYDGNSYNILHKDNIKLIDSTEIINILNKKN